GSGTTPAAGNWERLRFSATAGGSQLSHCVMRYGGILSCCTNYVPMVDVVDSSPAFDNCVFSLSSIEAISVSGTNAAPSISNSSIQSSNGAYAILQGVESNPTFSAVTATGVGAVNGVQINGGTITGSTHLRSMGLTYVVTSDLSVAVGATLTVDPGVIMKFTTNVGLYLDGALHAVGTPAAPIYFSSIHDDVGGDT